MWPFNDSNSIRFIREGLRVKDDDLARVMAGEKTLLFDGAMGTMLQNNGLAAGELPELLCLQQPDAITSIHRAYGEAGSEVVTTNTFGANARKLGGAAEVADVFDAAVACARAAGARYVAADVGPTGALIFPMGDLSFSEAYDLFAEQARAIEKTDADLVIIETMADVLEMTAAVLAIMDECTLPVFATMTFTASGRTFLGTTPGDAALVLAALGVDALGVNCSAGPEDLQPVVSAMVEVAPCPVIVQANAGLPEVVDGETRYSLTPEEYVRDVAPMIDAGASIVGGCCGTNPDYIREVAHLLDGHAPSPRAIDCARILEQAREVADAGSRDADILAEVLDAADRAALRQALADEYDED